jgi:hypothetical protein
MHRMSQIVFTDGTLIPSPPPEGETPKDPEPGEGWISGQAIRQAEARTPPAALAQFWIEADGHLKDAALLAIYLSCMKAQFPERRRSDRRNEDPEEEFEEQQAVPTTCEVF